MPEAGCSFFFPFPLPINDGLIKTASSSKAFSALFLFCPLYYAPSVAVGIKHTFSLSLLCFWPHDISTSRLYFIQDFFLPVFLPDGL